MWIFLWISDLHNIRSVFRPEPCSSVLTQWPFPFPVDMAIISAHYTHSAQNQPQEKPGKMAILFPETLCYTGIAAGTFFCRTLLRKVFFMSFITLQNRRPADASLVPDVFVDTYMPQANGEFVKIYLYLLRLSHKPDAQPTLPSLADVFSCTEKDVLRALRYWEKSGLLSLSFTGKELKEIFLFPLPEEGASSAEARQPENVSASVLSGQTDAASSLPGRLSGSRVKALQKENSEVRQLLFLAEQYLGRTLSPTDISRILYFYDELHFPMDLLEYLIEYCVSRGNTNLHYIEKVGLEWHKDGIATVKMAKSRTNSWNKSYFAILKAFGIRNRNPVPSETECMDRWLKEYGFSLDVITEACSRTVSQTGQASFQYAEGILSNWKAQGVKTPADIASQDARHKSARQNQPAGRTSRNSAPNRFNNFHQRDYDFANLEKQLLEKQLTDH
jgi:DnaD/phage-associated family protein